MDSLRGFDETGHRTIAHTADVIIEAWAPTRRHCFTEAVLAFVDTFVDRSSTTSTDSVSIAVEPASDTDMLVALLEEVLCLAEVMGVVPLWAVTEPTEDGGLAVAFDVAPAGSVSVIGAVPKAVSRHDLRFAQEDGLWRCRATIDV